jgi:hypothetical protein
MKRFELHVNSILAMTFIAPVYRLTRSGAHAAAFGALSRASHRLDVWLGGAAENGDLFPSAAAKLRPRIACTS